MKTKIFALILFVLAGLSTAYADKPAAESIHAKLSQAIQYPTQAVTAGIEGYVEVTFIIDDEGNIVIKSTFSSAPELEKYVKAQMSKINCNEINCLFNEHFKVRFDFRLA